MSYADIRKALQYGATITNGNGMEFKSIKDYEAYKQAKDQ